MPENSTATLTTYITDMHALINHGLKAIDRQAEHMRKKDPHPEALSVLGEFQRVLRGHLLQLDARAKTLGGKTTQPIKDAVTTLTGLAAGLISAVRPEEAAKGVRDDYTFLSHVAIGYLMLHTTASGLGDAETATLAEQGYRDAARLVMRIDQLLPSLVLQELRQDGLPVGPVGPVAEQSLMMVQRAWRREAPSAGFDAAPSAH
jgi:hypothetical protein